MAKQVYCHECQLSDFMNLANQIDDEQERLAFISLNYKDQLIIFNKNFTQTKSSDNYHKFDCMCHKYMSDRRENFFSPSFLQKLWFNFDQNQNATNRLLLDSYYYCSCIKTKLLLIFALIENFGTHNAIEKFNHVFHRVNLYAPLSKSQIINLL